MTYANRLAALLAGASILACVPLHAAGQQPARKTRVAPSDDDLLTPLVPPKPAADDDLLAPLVPPKKPPAQPACRDVLEETNVFTTDDGIELYPLVTVAGRGDKPKAPDDDLLAPLVPPSAEDRAKCQARLDQEIERKVARKIRKPKGTPFRVIGVEIRTYYPCFWPAMMDRQRRRCESREIVKHRGILITDKSGDGPDTEPAPPPPPPPPPPKSVGGRPPRNPGSPPGAGPRKPPSPPPAPSAGPDGPPPPTGGGPTGSPGGTPGGVAAPIGATRLADGWQRLKEFAVKMESARIDGQGRLDAIVVIRNETRAAQLVSRGDWTALVADADGLAKQDGVIWAATEGPPRDFTLMPSVPLGGTVRVRFVVAPPRVRTTLALFMLHQSGTKPAVFPLSNLDDRGDRTPPAVAAADVPFTTGALFDLRIDGMQNVGGRTQLFFTARNRSGAMQHADGGALRITAANGVTTDGNSYSVRGALGEQSGMAPVEPGAAVRLRAVFPGRVGGPFTFDDGKSKVAVAVPAAGAGKPVAEPVW